MSCDAVAGQDPSGPSDCQSLCTAEGAGLGRRKVRGFLLKSAGAGHCWEMGEVWRGGVACQWEELGAEASLYCKGRKRGVRGHYHDYG